MAVGVPCDGGLRHSVAGTVQRLSADGGNRQETGVNSGSSLSALVSVRQVWSNIVQAGNVVQGQVGSGQVLIVFCMLLSDVITNKKTTTNIRVCGRDAKNHMIKAKRL